MRYGYIIRMNSLTVDVGIPFQQHCIGKPEEFVFSLVSLVGVNTLGFYVSSILNRRGFGHHRRFS